MLVKPDKFWLPAVPLTPLHPPLAAHDAASVLDHDSMLEPLYATAVELALKVIVGSGGGTTVMVVLVFAFPPAPLHVSV